MKRLVLLSALLLPPGPATGQESFRGLGHLPDGISSTASAVSADGSVVVGTAADALETEAFRWTEADGMIGLGDFTGGEMRSAARGVSADGVVVVGFGTRDLGSCPCFWIPGVGIRIVGGCGGTSVATGVSADGLIIVGNVRGLATRWSNSGIGAYWFVSLLALGQAFGITPDGVVAVGGGWSGAALEPIRWVGVPGSKTFLQEGLGGDQGYAHATTPDGSVIVGWTKFNGIEFAFRWMESRPPDQRLKRLSDPLGDWIESRANGVSADGSIVVGTGNPREPKSSERAFVWDIDNGMRNFKTVLEHDFCLDLSGWTLKTATGISGDGLTIVGSGVTTTNASDQAWIARISPLAEADRDRDGIPNCADGCVFSPPDAPVDKEGRSLGDINQNCILDLDDYEFLSICLSISGPGETPPLTQCLDAFDVDDDLDVDVRDASSFQHFFGR